MFLKSSLQILSKMRTKGQQTPDKELPDDPPDQISRDPFQ